MDETHLLVKITNTTDDLAEQHAGVVVGQCGTTVALDDVIERAGRAKEHEVKTSVRGVDGVEEWEDVLVRKGFPDGCLVFEAFASL